MKWSDTVYAGKAGGYELKAGDVLNMVRGHLCLVTGVRTETREDGGQTVLIDTWNGNPRVEEETYQINAADGINQTDHTYDIRNIQPYFPEALAGIPEYKISFDANGGTAGFTRKKVREMACYGLMPLPEREGYYFAGWYTEKDGGEKITSYRTMVGGSDRTLYAHWSDTPIEYEKDTSGIAVNFDRYTGEVLGAKDRNATSISIPAEIDGVKVTALGYGAFQNMENLQMVSIPEGVEIINDSAFYGCSSLRSITIPDSVKEIGNYAFSRCYELKSVDLGKVEKIGRYAFITCRALAKLTLPGTIREMGEYAFSWERDLEKVVVSDGAAVIGDHNFNECYKLTKVYFAGGRNSVNISSTAFLDCPKSPELIDGDDPNKDDEEDASEITDSPGDGDTGKPDSSGKKDSETGKPDSSGKKDSETGKPDSSGKKDSETGKPDSSGKKDSETGKPDSSETKDSETKDSETGKPGSSSNGGGKGAVFADAITLDRTSLVIVKGKVAQIRLNTHKAKLQVKKSTKEIRLEINTYSRDRIKSVKSNNAAIVKVSGIRSIAEGTFKWRIPVE